MVANSNLELRSLVSESRLVAIIRGDDVDATVQTAKVLYDSGVRVLEVTLTLPNAEEAIRQISSFVPVGAALGAGTVLSESQVDLSLSSGASFIVTPALSPSVGYAVKENIGVLAGVYTPTEILQATDMGVAAVKLFPASTLGPGFVKAVREPLPAASIIPVGGISTEIIPEYLAAGALAVGVGGPLIGRAASLGGTLEGLEARAADFLRAVAK
jgi:2-dehydro-3-deoxyphosphogluconate aldolase / (4S)-4-hydroxy-2-oxoglutarate aldolase